jgi:hypothetical protein
MSTLGESDLGPVPAEIDTTKPHPARIYDYFLGGKDNFAADRETARQVATAWPAIRTSVRENRAFLARAVRYLAAEAGIDQFLDIGSGLPSVGNVHEVAQSVIPSARVVYVDNDPIVHVHGRALLASKPEGKCAYIQADLRQPKKILEHPVVRETLDLDRPIGLILVAVIHFLMPEDDPADIVRVLVDALAPGSYVVASHGSIEYGTKEEADAVLGPFRAAGVAIAPRDARDFADLVFDGLELVSPGVVLIPEWRPRSDTTLRPSAREVGSNGGVARKP